MGLQPSGLVCPDASNEGDWDQGAATGQTEYLSPAAGWTHLVHMHIRIFTPSELHPAQSWGEGDTIGAVGVHVNALCICL